MRGGLRFLFDLDRRWFGKDELLLGFVRDHIVLLVVDNAKILNFLSSRLRFFPLRFKSSSLTDSRRASNLSHRISTIKPAVGSEEEASISTAVTTFSSAMSSCMNFSNSFVVRPFFRELRPSTPFDKADIVSSFMILKLRRKPLQRQDVGTVLLFVLFATRDWQLPAAVHQSNKRFRRIAYEPLFNLAFIVVSGLRMTRLENANSNANKAGSLSIGISRMQTRCHRNQS